MAIETKVITIDGVDYYVNESTDGKIIEGGFPEGYYQDAIDPVSVGRVFVETNKYFPDAEYPEWIQPTNEGNMYMKDDKVNHNYTRYISDVNYNDWEPGVENWTEVTDGIVGTGAAMVEEEEEF